MHNEKRNQKREYIESPEVYCCAEDSCVREPVVLEVASGVGQKSFHSGGLSPRKRPGVLRGDERDLHRMTAKKQKK